MEVSSCSDTYSFKAGDNVTAYVYPINDRGENEILFVGSGSMFKNVSGSSSDLGDGVPNWGCIAGNNDRGIVRAVISNGITSIAGWTFTSMKKLEDVVIPKSITKIGEGSFACCTAVKEIYIPENVSYIDGKVAGTFLGDTCVIHVKGKSSAPSTWDPTWLTGFEGTVEWNCPHE